VDGSEVGCAAVAPRCGAQLMPNEGSSRKGRNDRSPAQPVGSSLVAGHESGDRFPDNAEVGGSIPPSPTGKVPGQRGCGLWRDLRSGRSIPRPSRGRNRSPSVRTRFILDTVTPVPA
jgi:hypothetical protein